MMKLLCLLLLLVNLFVAMYEFKYDVNYSVNRDSLENIQTGQEKILLVSELDQPSLPNKPSANLTQDPQNNSSPAVNANSPEPIVRPISEDKVLP